MHIRTAAIAHTGTALALGLMLTLGLAGCASKHNGDHGIASISNRPSATASATHDALSDQEHMLKFAQCMREHGIDMPDPAPGQGGGIKLPPGVDPKKVQDAQQQCKKYLPNGGEPTKADPHQAEQMRKFAQCMRDHGVTNFPDPDENGGIQISGGNGVFNPNDPTFQAAQTACEKYRPAGPSGGPTSNVTGGAG
jgi:hypothetical protein